MKACLTVTAILLLVVPNSITGDEIEFFVTGAQGDGLLPGNISPATNSNGSGDIGSTGIVFDTDTNTLNIDVEWGSENGYSDLTGEVTLLHLHGPTPSLPPFNFGEVNTDILINLGNSLNFISSGTGGGLIDNFFLSNDEEEWLLSGRTYINVHTAMYPTGEIRGYVVPVGFEVPEPGISTLLAACFLSVVCRGRHGRTRGWS